MGEPLSTFEETENPAGRIGSSVYMVSVETQGTLKESGVTAIPGHLMRWEDYTKRPVRFSYDYIVNPLTVDMGAVYIEFFDTDSNLVGKGEVYY